MDNTYEVNTGSSWVPYTFDTVINLNKGQSCKWRCTSHPTTFDDYTTYVQFVMTGSIEASGGVYSMLSSNLSDVTTLKGYDYAFIHLFENCKSLIKAPELPATTLTPDCYDHMFAGCTALTKSPQLPATTLASLCYSTMFQGCTALTKSPQLPATTLASSCYSSMFYECTALTQAPQLPATTLASSCYWSMFNGCSKLKEVHISATETAEDALNSWLYRVSSTGYFYCKPNATIFPRNSASGIPSGWVRLDNN